MTLQLDLFGDRERSRAEAWACLLDFDLAGARKALLELLAGDGEDSAARSALALVDDVALRIASLVVDGTDPIAAPFRLAAGLDPLLVPSWHACVARAAERRWGPAARVGGDPVGLHWLLAGRPDRAEPALALHLAREPTDARAHGYLGDARTLTGDRAGARVAYRQAFALEPRAVDRERLVDPALRDLAVVAATEYEVAGDPFEWVAAVGVVEGTLPLPEPELPSAAPPVSLDLVEPATVDVPRGLRFYRLLVHERSARGHERRVELRGAMKRLCPALLAAYLLAH